MDLTTIQPLAKAGFVFAPTSYGMTRSDWKDWPNLATADVAQLKQWIEDGCNLVTVAKHGHGYVIDIDDRKAAKQAGFKAAWLRGMFLVNTPSGGLHAYPTLMAQPHSIEFLWLGRLGERGAFIVKGLSGSHSECPC